MIGAAGRGPSAMHAASQGTRPLRESKHGDGVAATAPKPTDAAALIEAARYVDLGQGLVMARRSEAVSGLYTQGLWVCSAIVIQSADWIALAHVSEVDGSLRRCVEESIASFAHETGQDPEQVAIGWSPAALLAGMEVDRQDYLRREPARALLVFFENWADECDPAELFGPVPQPHEGRGSDEQWALAKNLVVERFRLSANAAAADQGVDVHVFEVPDRACVLVPVRGELELIPEERLGTAAPRGHDGKGLLADPAPTAADASKKRPRPQES